MANGYPYKPDQLPLKIGYETRVNPRKISQLPVLGNPTWQCSHQISNKGVTFTYVLPMFFNDTGFFLTIHRRPTPGTQKASPRSS